MKVGDHGVLVFGVALRDDQADVVYGLYARYLDRHVHLPGEDKLIPRQGTLRRQEAVEVPTTDLDGRHWIGVWLADMLALPPVLEHKVWPADSQELAGLVRLPHVDTRVRHRAAEAMALFAAWCERRGVTLGQPQLFVSADYS
jgi:hypothetical protein